MIWEVYMNYIKLPYCNLLQFKTENDLLYNDINLEICNFLWLILIFWGHSWDILADKRSKISDLSNTNGYMMVMY